MTARIGHRAVIEPEAIDELLGALRRRGFRVIGPALRGAAIVYEEIDRAADLPIGWTADLEAGTYALRRRDDGALFGYASGPQSWKPFLFPPASTLWREGETSTDPGDGDPPRPLAFVGVRSCDLHAIAIQDRVFLEGPAPDPIYAARRAGSFIVAVNCGTAGGTCFCVSMGTGPRATSGFDLALTELLDGRRHELLVEVGSERGADVLDEVTHRTADPADLEAADSVIARTAASMGRTLETDGIKELLYANVEHPRWDDVAARCLSCTNCTLVCPTCFCFAVETTNDLGEAATERRRVWDSCFALEHSYIHGGVVRASNRARYRQWTTHKLATWIDQFGTSGCVGCGRCITWCPVGIDITEEVAAIRASPGATRGKETRDADG
jgi:ferredoxin